MATRRTHIVRCKDDSGGSDYFDLEVLDAVAFKTENGKEMVLNCPTDKAVPYIVDDTGGDHAKTPGDATRRSHMKRIKNPDDPKQEFDAEILDCIAFRGENGEEWILNLPADKADPYNVTAGSGTSKSTRRTHEEKVYPNRKDKTGADFLTVERCDMMAFRTINGKEMIIEMESHDDGGKRADTHIVSPAGYDPDDENGPEPPANSDEHNYIKFVKGASGIFTGAEKIDQGPLWWIRKVSSGSDFMILSFRFSAIQQEGASLPAWPFTKFAYDSDQFDVFTLTQALINPNGTKPELKNPPSAAMYGSDYMFNVKPPVTFVTHNNFEGILYQQRDVYLQLVFNISAIKRSLPANATSVTIGATTPKGGQKMTGVTKIIRGGSTVFANSEAEAIAEYLSQASTLDSFGGIVNGDIHAFVTPGHPDLWSVVTTEYYTPTLRTSTFWAGTGYTFRSKNVDKKQAIKYTTSGDGTGDQNSPAPQDQINGYSAPLDKWTGVSTVTFWSDPPFRDQPADFNWTIDLKTLQFINPTERDLTRSIGPNNPETPTP